MAYFVIGAMKRITLFRPAWSLIQAERNPEMWNAYIDEKNQVFVIETRNGAFIAKRDMPSQSVPNPGKEELMSIPANRQAWERIVELVEAANRGKGD